ncbi:MAG TPA: putative LPS assembly protein LptD, partial [Ottowia sp.]|nr:putative LPS assembly protein LptD [Ottowia sp.]
MPVSPPFLPIAAASRVRPRWALHPLLAGVLALLCGAATAQPGEPLALRATPLLAEQPPSHVGAATTVYGQRVRGRIGLETVLEGQAELRQPGTVAQAERLSYDQGSDIVTVSGGVRLNKAGDRYTAESGQLRVDAMEGFLLRPTYRFLASGAHGEAERLEWLDRDRASVIQGSYTTCPRGGPDWVPDWIVRADRLDLDREDDEGRASGAVLEFKGVPVLPVPALSFPISERRRSGWLPPTLGLDNKSGLDLSVPYYWNIAPNRDATFTPGLMSRRGVDLAGEFR